MSVEVEAPLITVIVGIFDEGEIFPLSIFNDYQATISQVRNILKFFVTQKNCISNTAGD